MLGALFASFILHQLALDLTTLVLRVAGPGSHVMPPAIPVAPGGKPSGALFCEVNFSNGSKEALGSLAASMTASGW